VVQTLIVFAGVYVEEGKSDEAKLAKAVPLYDRALAIQEANLGPADAGLLSVLEPYAELLAKLHDDAKASEVRARMSSISAAQRNSRN
jgi:hypothetical protein